MKRCTGCGESKEATFKYFYHAQKNPDGLATKCRACTKELNRLWRTKNPEKLAKYRRDYYGGPNANPRGLWAMLGERSREKKRGKRGKRNCTVEEFIAWFNSQDMVCVYCDITPEDLHKDTINNRKNYSITRLSIDRKFPEGNYEPSNMVFACMRCNWIKSDFFTYEEMLEIGHRYIKPKRQHIGAPIKA